MFAIDGIKFYNLTPTRKHTETLKSLFHLPTDITITLPRRNLHEISSTPDRVYKTGK